MPGLHKRWGETLSIGHDARIAPAAAHQGAVQARKVAIDHIAQHADPTPNKEYTDRLLSWYHKGQFRTEDSPRIKDVVTKFHQLKTRIKPEHVAHLGDQAPKNPKDFNSYGSIADVEDAVMNAQGEKTKSMAKAGDREVVENGTTLLHKSDDLEVREVHNVHAMKVLGRGTRWCTAADKDNMFHYYHQQGPLHFIHDKKNNARYLHHAEEEQFMDERDEPAEDKAEELGKRHPILHKLLHHDHRGPFYDNEKGHRVMDTHVAQLARNAAALAQAGEAHARPIGGMTHDQLVGMAMRATDPKLLERVHKLSFAPTAALASNKHTPAHVLRDLATKEPHAVTRNPNADTVALDAAVDTLRSKPGTTAASYGAAAYHKNASADTLRKIYDGDSLTSLRIAHRHDAPSDLLHRIAQDGVADPGAMFLPSAVHAVARNPNTQGHTLEMLHKKYGFAMHDNLADHPNTPSHVLHAVAQAEHMNSSLSNRIHRHPNATAETKHRLDTHFGALTQSKPEPFTPVKSSYT